MAKKRKVKKGRVFILVMISFLFIFTLLLAFKKIYSLIDNKNTVSLSSLDVNNIDFSEMQELNIDLNSKSYLLVRLNDFKALYGKDVDEKFYPASLAKIVTLDTVVKNANNLNDVSYIGDADYESLIEANASLAYLTTNYEYTIDDLLYALVLPSGGDGALALENYFSSQGENLVSLMNENVKNLNLNNSNFTNTTGLHNDNLYTTLSDYASIVVDCLNYDESKNVLMSFSHTLSDGLTVRSTLSSLNKSFDDAVVYGGKTGFTGQAGENIMVLFSCKNRSYMLILTGADGNPYVDGENYHLIDANSVIKYLSD